MNRNRASWLPAALLTAALLSGCGSAEQSGGNGDAHIQHAANGDLQEVTASVDQLPSFLDGLDPMIAQVYTIAAANRDLLASIPCYCGCGEEAGHQHNGNCFIKEERADGSIVWDDHGTRCGVCLEIAVVSSKMKTEGKSVEEIRRIIDDTYKEGYAIPTPTPMPS